jgi:hypothetical protein
MSQRVNDHGLGIVVPMWYPLRPSEDANILDAGVLTLPQGNKAPMVKLGFSYVPSALHARCRCRANRIRIHRSQPAACRATRCCCS